MRSLSRPFVVGVLISSVAIVACGDDSKRGDAADAAESVAETSGNETNETGDGDPSTGDGDPSTGDGDPSTGDGDPNCLPFEIACDGIDEDCNGIIDDVDLGNDGFCDCYKIGILGNKGSNPAANFEAWLEDKGTTATRFGTAVDHQLTLDDLADFDILIVDRLTHSYTAQEAALLQSWLDQGHGMISMAGYVGSQTDIDQQNSLVSVTGLAYAQPLYFDPVEVWLDHPIAQGVEGVQIYGGWQVVGNGTVFVRPQGEPNTSLGTTVPLAGEDAAVIVFSDEWISFDSEWQNIPEVETFWSNMIAWVGPKNFCVTPQ
jgi:hypothetical protein